MAFRNNSQNRSADEIGDSITAARRASFKGVGQPAPDEYMNQFSREGGGAQVVGLKGGNGFTDPLMKLADMLGQADYRSQAHTNPYDPSDRSNDKLRDLFAMMTGNRGSTDTFEQRLNGTPNQARATPGGFSGISHLQAQYNPPPVRRSSYATKYEALLEELQMQQLRNALSNSQGNSQDDGLRQDRINTMRRFLQAAQPYKG